MKTYPLFWTELWNALPEIHAFLKHPSGTTDTEVSREISAFLSSLSGEEKKGGGSFLSLAADAVLKEWDEASGFAEKAAASAGEGLNDQAVLDLFFPEASYGGESYEEQEKSIREKRTIRIDSLNADPVTDPASQIIFTSNVLLTLPPEDFKPRLSDEMRQRAEEVEREEQKYWFDHPILMGIETEANEMIYGLKGLAETFRWEKEKGGAAKESRMTVILSLSVTHEGLASLAHEYMAGELAGCDGLDDLDIYLFTEEDTEALSDALGTLLDEKGAGEKIASVFGVNGRYGRHYSFLKAVAPLWTIAVDPEVKGTFKIDLDQVFPQSVLVRETGKSAFEHFRTPLWGALGRDEKGHPVEMGMIAGALVNEKDIASSLFTPDVPLPEDGTALHGEARVFNKQHPMAVSTLAEMMTKYGEEGMPDGETSCLSRVHVTGGTNGILCSSLRRMKPFTPGFIGRAEDQAYLLSVILDRTEPGLRYVHEPGLVMRHDKEAFAGASIEAAKLGTWVADLLRVIYFSYYSRFLPGGTAALKDATDPFTGCFITPVPLTMVFLRLILKMLEEPENARTLLDLARQQLTPFVDGTESSATVETQWREERRSWDLYYKALDCLEESGERDKETFREILLACKIS